MSQIRFWLAIVLGLAICTGGLGRADEPKTDKGKEDPARTPAVTPSQTKRLLYTARNLPPGDLARALKTYFKGEVDATTVSENSNALLLNATPAILDELGKTLEQLDARVPTIEVDVILAVVRTDGKEGRAKIEEADLSGPADKVMAKVQTLRKAAVFETTKQIRLTALENQKVTDSVQASTPFVVGSTVTATGVTLNRVTYRNLGVSVTAKPRRSTGGVAVELTVEDTRGYTPEELAAIGANDKGKPAPAAEFVTAQLQTTVRVPAGQAILAKGVKTESKDGDARTLVIVTARVVEDEKK
jgi:type II secretory pathway component GspD/PulD (secretin)